MCPALGHVHAVESDVLRVAGNADDHVRPGLERSEPDTKTHVATMSVQRAGVKRP
jgi:hypothetical protein